jgi:small subunit ribosomal protein S16
MALTIRLRQQGRKNLAIFRLVLTDIRCKRDGKYLEMLGWYHPAAKDETKQGELFADKITHWLDLGAVPSENAMQLMNRFCPEVLKTYLAKKKAQAEKKRDKARARRNK